MTKAELERASELCRLRGAWLIVDNTYEHFTYDGRQHVCVSAPHVLHIFSFSKVWASARAHGQPHAAAIAASNVKLALDDFRIFEAAILN